MCHPSSLTLCVFRLTHAEPFLFIVRQAVDRPGETLNEWMQEMLSGYFFSLKHFPLKKCEQRGVNYA